MIRYIAVVQNLLHSGISTHRVEVEMERVRNVDNWDMAESIAINKLGLPGGVLISLFQASQEY